MIPGAVINPGLWFKLQSVFCMTTSSLITLWVAERMSLFGIGNGVSIITFANIIASSFTPLCKKIYQFATHTNSLNVKETAIVFVIIAALLYAFIFEVGVYNIKVFFVKSKSTSQNYVSDMPIKLNPVGIMPAMFAETLSGPITLIFRSVLLPRLMLIWQSALMTNICHYFVFFSKILKIIGYFIYSIFATPIDYVQNKLAISILSMKSSFINYSDIGSAAFLLARSGLLILFAFVCISINMDPEDISDSLRSRSVNILGVRAGKETSNFMERLLNAVSAFGASCLVIVCAITPFILSLMGISFSGTSIVIVLGVAIELFYKFNSIVV
jgi:preprotein translocase subunit SecY